MLGSWDPTALAWWVSTGFSCSNRIIHACLWDLPWPVGVASAVASKSSLQEKTRTWEAKGEDGSF